MQCSSADRVEHIVQYAMCMCIKCVIATVFFSCSVEKQVQRKKVVSQSTGVSVKASVLP